MSCHLNAMLKRLYFARLLAGFFNGLKYNHWVRHSVIKSFDSMAFQKRKSTREGKNDKSDNFEMDIFDEVVLDKAQTVPEKT